MPQAKKICIVCEKNIDVARGNEIKRCTHCNNTVCNKHFDICRICEKVICNNELRSCGSCLKDQCKNCTIKTRDPKTNSISLYCLHCSSAEK